MPFRDQPKCKICKSIHRPDIDKMLHANENYGKIVDWARKRGLDINKHNLTRHKQRHTKITDDEIEAKLQEQRIDAEKKIAAKEAEGDVVQKYVAAATVLEEIVNKVYAGIQDKTLTPTIDNGLKAIELQARLKDGHGMESQILEFMMEFTREPGEIKQTTGLRIITSRDRPDGIVNGLEEITGARIRTGLDAVTRAEMGEGHVQNPAKNKEIYEKPMPTVDTTLPAIKQIAVQGNLFGETGGMD